ncbi:MAG: tRNA (N6-isopentenyl adenosine(37)-C2)-methylthiotransferase MiaB [Bacilli bacterium]
MILPDMIEAKKRTDKEVLKINYKKNKSYENMGKGKLFYLRTYGCQMNEHDSEEIKGILYSVGYIETLIMGQADLIILNTCAIRENVHDKVFGLLGRVKSLKEIKPEVIVGVGGCMPQELSVSEKIVDKLPFVNFVFGTHNFTSLLDFINDSYNLKQIVNVESIEGNIIEGTPIKRNSNVSGYVNIILGCDKFCTYCIVPLARGKQRSREKEKIIEEIINLKNNGYKEVVLLGQNVNAYGKDLYTDYDLSELLKDVSDTGIDRIRFVTSHPWDFSDKMIDVIKHSPNIMPWFHLPVQSGSDKILKLMGRRYKVNEYISLVKKIRREIPYSCITTDIIVGFPQETEEDFNLTLNLVNEIKFDTAYTFAFSKRKGTPAEAMEETVSEDEKLNRLHILNTLVNKYSSLSNKLLENTEVKCLVTGISEKNNKRYTGYTECMKIVNIESEEDITGKIVLVKILKAKSFSLDGVLVTK